MQEQSAAQSIAGSVRQTLTKLEVYQDRLDEKESSLEKIRMLTKDLEYYEREIERALSAIEWLDESRCEIRFSREDGAWVVCSSDGRMIGSGSDVISALEDANNPKS